jgi:hypothetical protein
MAEFYIPDTLNAILPETAQVLPPLNYGDIEQPCESLDLVSHAIDALIFYFKHFLLS